MCDVLVEEESHGGARACEWSVGFVVGGLDIEKIAFFLIQQK